MAFWNIFKKHNEQLVRTDYPDEYVRVLSFDKRFDTLLSQDRFITRSDYKGLITEFADLLKFVKTLQSLLKL